MINYPEIPGKMSKSRAASAPLLMYDSCETSPMNSVCYYLATGCVIFKLKCENAMLRKEFFLE